MAVIGAAVLAGRGYSPAQIGQLAQISAQQQRDVRVWQSGGITYLSWGYPHGGAGLGHQRGAGITGRYIGGKGAWEVYDPAYRKTTLTEDETRFVLPVARPGGEVISFNPFQRKAPSGAAVGQYFYPEAPKRRAEIHVRPLTPADVERITKRALRGQSVPELYRYMPEKKPPTPYGMQTGIASLFTAAWGRGEAKRMRGVQERQRRSLLNMRRLFERLR